LGGTAFFPLFLLSVFLGACTNPFFAALLGEKGKSRKGETTYTVSFESNGGSSVTAQTVAEGGTVTEPPAMSKAAHFFIGWYREAAFTNAWNFAADTVMANTTLYAYWIPFKMVTVPGGHTFPTGADDSGTATVDHAYEIGETEVTYELWYTVRVWAEGNGYTFYDNPGREGSSGADTAPGVNRQEPVTEVTWFDAVVWLNALTGWVNEKTGNSLTPVYYYESACATVAEDSNTSNFEKEDPAHSYRSAYAKLGATGFRLPTSNEWELAARWQGSDTGNTVSTYTDPYFTKGNSASGATAAYTDGPATGAVAWYNNNNSLKTQAVKGRAANGLGLCDMSGNVWEWCYDWYPDGSGRIIRGGGWNNYASSLQLCFVYYFSPDDRYNITGFRPARTAQ
jgi:formylglycine-generating enzyme required for sulfatase activity